MVSEKKEVRKKGGERESVVEGEVCQVVVWLWRVERESSERVGMRCGRVHCVKVFPPIEIHSSSVDVRWDLSLRSPDRGSDCLYKFLFNRHLFLLERQMFAPVTSEIHTTISTSTSTSASK